VVYRRSSGATHDPDPDAPSAGGRNQTREPPVHRRSGWCLHLRDCIDLCAEIMEEELQGG
jgi:hypothetical protein